MRIIWPLLPKFYFWSVERCRKVSNNNFSDSISTSFFVFLSSSDLNWHIVIEHLLVASDLVLIYQLEPITAANSLTGPWSITLITIGSDTNAKPITQKVFVQTSFQYFFLFDLRSYIYIIQYISSVISRWGLPCKGRNICWNRLESHYCYEDKSLFICGYFHSDYFEMLMNTLFKIRDTFSNRFFNIFSSSLKKN